MPQLKEKGEYPVIDEGVYTAEVLEVVEKSSTFYFNDDGTPKIDVVWKFVISDDQSPFDGQFVWGRTPPWFTTSPECKLRRWSERTLKVTEFPADFFLDYPDLVGREVSIFVKHGTTGKAKVDEILAPKTTTGVATASAQPAPAAVTAAVSAPADVYGLTDEPF